MVLIIVKPVNFYQDKSERKSDKAKERQGDGEMGRKKRKRGEGAKERQREGEKER